MDAVRNPFAPGAGSPPPELAGRDEIICDADTALQRILLGKHAKSQILLGLRGTGKTVLLNKIEGLAEDRKHLTSFIEAPEGRKLTDLLYPKIHQVLRKLSTIEQAKAFAYSAMRALRGFASGFKIEVGDLSISVDPLPGVADSGDLEIDLPELFMQVGRAANAAGMAWTLIIDEVQYLAKADLSAIIVALHRVSQKKLPILFFGGGLPQIASLSGNAKSYAERLFDFPPIGPLDTISAASAIRQPILDEGESISDKAVKIIVEKTAGYPYFLQEWGFQSWNIATQSPITGKDAKAASVKALERLDNSFFRVRYDRLTPAEREYVLAMASLGHGPYRSSDVADVLGKEIRALGPRRASIISKGMIYSRAQGDIDFTVPMFDDFLRRTES